TSNRRPSLRSRPLRLPTARCAAVGHPKNHALVPGANPSAERSTSSLERTMSNRIAPKLLAEFVGTLSLIFIGAGAAAVVGDGIGLPGIAAIAFAHGLTVTAFAFAYGPVSGGHFNPSVTIAVLAAGAMRAGEAAGYIVSQLVGGILGALLLRTVLGGAAT